MDIGHFFGKFVQIAGCLCRILLDFAHTLADLGGRICGSPGKILDRSGNNCKPASGIPGPRRPMSAAEFGAAFRLPTIPREAIVFTQEDDRWLLA